MLDKLNRNIESLSISNNGNEKIFINQYKTFALNKTNALLSMCRVHFYNDTLKIFS